jgi:hypothetical protein
MTPWEFERVLIGEPVELPDGSKARYVVADAIDRRASLRRKEGRPDIGGRLTWAASRIRYGDFITKKVRTRIHKDLQAIMQDVVTHE